MRAHERKPLARIGVSALCQLGYQPALQCRSYWWRPQPARRALALGQSMDASCDDLRRHLYKDNNGHPGTLLAQAALTSPSSAIRCIEVGPVKRVLRAALLACRVPGPPVPSTTRGAYRRMGPGNDSPHPASLVPRYDLPRKLHGPAGALRNQCPPHSLTCRLLRQPLARCVEGVVSAHGAACQAPKPEAAIATRCFATISPTETVTRTHHENPPLQQPVAFLISSSRARSPDLGGL